MTDSPDSRLASEEFLLEPESTERLANLCGPLNCHLQALERHFGVRINNRGHRFWVAGEGCREAACFLKHLYAGARQRLTLDDIHTGLQHRAVEEMMDDRASPAADEAGDEFVLRTQSRVIKPRGANQKRYVRHIDSFDLTFGIGPAGTGKTYLAVAKGVEALEKETASKLILVRPAVEAGESLGFLPGDLQQKTDPYLRPMYDALYEMLKFEKVRHLIDQGVIEVAPLAYMRGRSLNDSFIILDEGQNTTKEQMKMLLTRIGVCSKAIVTGDLTQVDLPGRQQSGLEHAVAILKGIDNIAFSFFDADDVIRHPLLRKIIDAYGRDTRAASLHRRGTKPPHGVRSVPR